MTLHIGLIHQKGERHLEGIVDLTGVELEREARLHARDHRDDAIAECGHIEIEITQWLDIRAIEADLFFRLTQGRSPRVGLAFLYLAAREGALASVVGQ